MNCDKVVIHRGLKDKITTEKLTGFTKSMTTFSSTVIIEKAQFKVY